MSLRNRTYGILWMALLQVLFTLAEIKPQDCDLLTCHPCFSTSVTCNTADKNKIIPQYLTTNLTRLKLTFRSPDSSPVQFCRSDIVRYKTLEDLTISGDFSSIEAGAISVLPSLISLTIKQTRIGQLPDLLLAHSEKLTSLVLEKNFFRSIPWNTMDKPSRIPLKQFIFSGNGRVSLPCSNGTMQLLPNIKNAAAQIQTLDLSYNTFYNHDCASISYDFFSGLSNLVHLSVGGSNLVQMNEHILFQFNRLSRLDISSLTKYKTCPSSSEKFLQNLPSSIRRLIINHWETSIERHRSCTLRNGSLAGLLKLDHLTSLAFSFSNGIFGPVLLRGTIPQIRSLNTLDVSYCHIYSVGKDALDGFPNLSKIILTGNPLSSTDLDLLSRPSDIVQEIYLQETLIRSDDDFQYQVSNLFCDFPNLRVIRFSSNSLKRMPLLIDTCQIANASTHQTMVSTFAIDGNMIERFVEAHVQEGSICSILSNVENLYLSRNKLIDLSGLELCSNLRNLQLDHNSLLNFDQTDFSIILHRLNRTRKLNLGYNRLGNMTDDLLVGLPLLEQFDLSGNHITRITARVFRGNPKLRFILLQGNRIKYLEPSGFDNLIHLEKITLADNKLTTIPQHILSTFDSLQLVSLKIGNNPFDCDCDKRFLQKWMLKNMELLKYELNSMHCSSPSKRRGDFVHNYKDDAYDCVVKGVIIVAASIVGGASIISLGIMIFKYRWYLRHIKIVWKAFRGSMENVKKEYICKYHAYISFDSKSASDSAWVVNELIPALEEPQSYGNAASSSALGRRNNRSSAVDAQTQSTCKLRLYVEQRDAAAGGRRFAQKQKALENSKRILIIASNSYLRSGECLSDADLAGVLIHGSDSYQPNRILVLMREELSAEIIRAPISSLLLGKTLKVETDDQRKMEMWKKIRKFLSKPLYMYCKPERASSNNEEKEQASGSEPNPCSDDDMPLLDV